MTFPAISLVIPAHDEAEALPSLLGEAARALAGLEAEILVVDDGSTDGSAAVLASLSAGALAGLLRPLSHPRRMGQSAALATGFAAARGGIVISVDGDGQDDPADAVRLARELAGRADLAGIVGWRERRADSAGKRLQSAVANAVRRHLLGDGIRDIGCGVKAFRREALGQLPWFDGAHRFLPALVQLGGGRIEQRPVAHRPRRGGRSHYGLLARALRGAAGIVRVRRLQRG